MAEPSVEGYAVQWADSLGAFSAHVHFTRMKPPKPEENVVMDGERLSTLVELGLQEVVWAKSGGCS